MMRINSWIMIAVLLGLGACVYNVADRVQIKEKKLSRLGTKIASEQESLRVLTAEWTYLTNPDRLEKLTASHFKLVPMDGSQYIALAAIPLREAMDALENENLNGHEAPVEKRADAGPQMAAALPTPAASLPPLAVTRVNVTTVGVR